MVRISVSYTLIFQSTVQIVKVHLYYFHIEFIKIKYNGGNFAWSKKSEKIQQQQQQNMHR